MKATLKLLVLAVSLLGLAGCCTPSGRTAAAWEYRVIEGWTRTPERAQFESDLNAAGKEGYVIASSTTLPGDASNAPKTTVIMKRPRP